MTVPLLLSSLVSFPAAAAPYEHLPPLFPQEIAAADPVQGAQIRIDRGAGEALLEALYLTDTDAVIEAYAGLARVTVQQWFVNPDPALHGEATYLMPLPDGALVDQVEVRCEDRRLSAGIEPRQGPLLDGKPLERFLLDETGILAWNIGQVCAGEIAVTVQYTAPLSYEGGRFSLALPPEPGAPPSTPWSETGPAPHQAVTIYTDPGMPLTTGIGAGMVVYPCDGDRQRAHLSRDDGGGVWLSWDLVGAAATIYRPDPAQPGYIALTIAPSLLGQLSEHRPRELLFVVDRSCSMAGPPSALAQDALLGSIATLGEGDRFNVYALSGEVPPLFSAAQPISAQTTAAVADWLRLAPAGSSRGGAPGLVAALQSPPALPEDLRILLLLTDGHFDGTGLREAVQGAGSEPRLYAVGLGGYPNRALLDALAHDTRGDTLYPQPDTDPGVAARQVVALLQPPTLTDVEIDWGGLQVFHQLPLRLPDLHAHQPLRVVARYDGPLEGKGDILVRVQGQLGRYPTVVELPVAILPQEPHHEGLATLWAAEQIEALSTHAIADQQPERMQQLMTTLAVEHHLVTRYTRLASPDLGPGGLTYTAPAPLPLAISPALAALAWKDAPPASPAPALSALPALTTAPEATPEAAPTIFMSTVGMNIPTGEAADLIRRLVQVRQGQIRHCYEQRLKMDGSLEGQITVELEVQAGKVMAIRLAENTTGDAEMGSCALQRIASWEYPDSVSGRMELPFRLSTRRR